MIRIRIRRRIRKRSRLHHRRQINRHRKLHRQARDRSFKVPNPFDEADLAFIGIGFDGFSTTGDFEGNNSEAVDVGFFAGFSGREAFWRERVFFAEEVGVEASVGHELVDEEEFALFVAPTDELD
ncbi:hypothetical protein AKJ16_DCAP24910 [Drosera capensis]